MILSAVCGLNCGCDEVEIETMETNRENRVKEKK